jgi:hypothetical protein
MRLLRLEEVEEAGVSQGWSMALEVEQEEEAATAEERAMYYRRRQDAEDDGDHVGGRSAGSRSNLPPPLQPPLRKAVTF